MEEQEKEQEEQDEQEEEEEEEPLPGGATRMLIPLASFCASLFLLAPPMMRP